MGLFNSPKNPDPFKMNLFNSPKNPDPFKMANFEDQNTPAIQVQTLPSGGPWRFLGSDESTHEIPNPAKKNKLPQVWSTLIPWPIVSSPFPLGQIY